MGCPSVARAPPPVRAERTRRAAQHTPRDARHTHTRARVEAHHVDASTQEVAVAGWIIVRAARQPAVELRGELGPVRLDVLTGALDALGKAADADVEPAALLRHVPRVSRQPLLAEPQVAVAVLPVVLDLVLECHDLQLVRTRVQLAEQVAVHRAACTAGADEIAAAIR